MSEARYGPIADRIAQQAGIPPDLFRRLIGAESSWNPRAGSNMGAQGLTQLMPATARGLGVSNVHDPVQNMRGGARYLRQQYDKFKRWDYALAAYNAGPGAVQQYGGIPPYRETQAYVPKVLGGRDYPAPGAAPGPSGRSAPPPAREFAETARALPGQPLDGDRLWMLLENQRKRSLRGLMPAKGFQPQLGKLASMALERAQAQVQPGGSYPAPPPAAPSAPARGGQGAAQPPSPGGDWGGTYQPAMGAAEIAKRHGLQITSTKRDRRGTASGGVSDHWSGSTNAYAVDLGWGGSRPTSASDRAASEIVASLGGPQNWGSTGGNFTKTVNGLRWQVIYRSDVGGNHWDHIHVGVRRA